MGLHCSMADFPRWARQAGRNLALRDEDLVHHQVDSTFWAKGQALRHGIRPRTQRHCSTVSGSVLDGVSARKGRVRFGKDLRKFGGQGE